MIRTWLAIIVIVVCITLPVVLWVWEQVKREDAAYDLTRRKR